MRPRESASLRPSLSEILDPTSTAARELTLQQVSVTEKDSITQIGKIAKSLQTVSFLRPATAKDPEEYAISYSLDIVPETLLLAGSTPTVRPGHVDIGSCTTVPATVDQVDAWPHTRSISLRYTLRKLWAVSPELRHHIAMSYIHDHQTMSITLAGISGCFMAEMVRGLYTVLCFVPGPVGR